MNDGDTRRERRHRRCTVRILTEFSTGEQCATAFATTLGGGGLFLETEQPLPRGTPMLLSFRVLPGRPPHRIAGRVVWSHTPTASGIGRTSGMGIEFTDEVAAARVAQELDALV